MKPQRLIIPGKLPSLNEYIRYCHNSHYTSNTAKSNADHIVALCAKQQKIKRVSGKAYIKIAYFDRDARIDNDNCAFAKKFILDGLVKAGVLKDDRRQFLTQPRPWTEDFFIDRKNPRIEITIHEVRSEK